MVIVIGELKLLDIFAKLCSEKCEFEVLNKIYIYTALLTALRVDELTNTACKTDIFRHPCKADRLITSVFPSNNFTYKVCLIL